jgi:hypothetical protein
MASSYIYLSILAEKIDISQRIAACLKGWRQVHP